MNWMNNYGFQFFNIQGKDVILKKIYPTWASKRNNSLTNPFRLISITEFYSVSDENATDLLRTDFLKDCILYWIFNW